MADIAHLKALEAQATKGEWFVYDGSIAVEACAPETGPYPVRVLDGNTVDLALVAPLRNAAPAMLEVCAAAKEWREAPTGQAVVTASKRLWAALDALEACRE